jgi:hypothetical protein
MLNKIVKIILGLFKSKFTTGALESPVDPRRVSLASFIQPVSLPNEMDTELGEVYDQNPKSCCVGCAITGVASEKLNNDSLSYDDLYDECKKIDGIPNVLGTYPVVGAHQATKVGIATKEAYNSKDPVKMAKSRSLNKLSGYAFVEATFDAICQAIFLSGAVTASFKVNSNWFRGIMTKVLSFVGLHYVILKGFNVSNQTLKGRNSWGVGWIGYIAGIVNPAVKKGEFEMRWEDYKDNIYDIIVFTYVPPEVLEEATKYDYRFVKTLKYGSSGFEVKKLQERLGIKADGAFGKKTKQAVIDFQSRNSLLADGIVGAKTRAVLNKNVVSYIPTWAKAIQTHEGYYVGSRSYRNNNPANFKVGSKLTSFMVSLGATGVDSGGFCIFSSYEIGFNALVEFLKMACTDRLISYRGNMTLAEFFAVYAPSSDNNNPLEYAKAVAKAVGATIETKIVELL